MKNNLQVSDTAIHTKHGTVKTRGKNQEKYFIIFINTTLISPLVLPVREKPTIIKAYDQGNKLEKK